MGNSESSSIHDYRSHNVPLKLPMPDGDEIDEKFDRVLVRFLFVTKSKN